MSWRRFVLVPHRWNGLSTSLVLAIAGGTGIVRALTSPGEFRRPFARLHEDLMLGNIGSWIVLNATAGAVLLQLGGVILWWKRKTLRVRTAGGWRTAVSDLHH